MRLLKSKVTGQYKVAECKDGKNWIFYGPYQTEQEGRDKIKQLKRNFEARLKNSMLRELCGTSARAAREDMGL